MIYIEIFIIKSDTVMKFNSTFFSSNLLLLLLSISLITCIEPVEPEFEFRENLVFVEGFVGTSEGASFVNLNESVLNGSGYLNVFIEGAEVTFINTKTNEVVRLIEEEEIYVPPSNFVASIGDLWKLEVNLADGRQYESLPELISEPVAISSLNATYDPNLVFRESSNEFVPGHSISVTLDDPIDKENYYYWRFRSFEKIVICVLCNDGIFRNGACEDHDPPFGEGHYHTYTCDSDCWKIRYNENIKLFTDRFSNGNTINELPIGDVLLYTKRDILVEVQQYSLSPSGYTYYKKLKDVVDNNSGFNAPPPAALIGNMFNPNDSEEFVLGRFTAASTVTSSIFIDNRSDITERQLEAPPPIPMPEDFPEFIGQITVSSAPCIEGRFRTSIRPDGWPSNK